MVEKLEKTLNPKGSSDSQLTVDSKGGNPIRVQRNGNLTILQGGVRFIMI